MIIVWAAPLAAPCSGPSNALSAAVTEEYGSALADAATRAARVETARSWSIPSTSAAFSSSRSASSGCSAVSAGHRRSAIDLPRALLGAPSTAGSASTAHAIIRRPAERTDSGASS